ncbi:MAG: hypothetical protein ALECFALPRED_000770 [Alectoria fallacina]|uniref:Uncharacterized protein n=1 Tax=Alectoria fallacina TaxID=1903189 RepID=A0A8H3FAS5_9LECA|nr:MAG: hypothetical protein ALECFALPRED_000770 [Alectoria fallacina]
MKFTRSKKEPKKSPEEEYAEHISSLTESELRDLHKDLKIDHYGNSTAAVINTASGVGLLSMRSTTRRYRTECMQIEAMEARMKEMGWTAHPTRYRDAVPIALGVAAGTTAGMSFGLINVEKNAKRTKDYVMKTDLFRTKELVETTKEIDAETDEAEEIEEVEIAETTTEHVVVEHGVARKQPAPAAETEEEAEVAEEVEVAESSTEPTQALGTTTEHTTTITEATSVVSAADPTTAPATHPPPSADARPATTTEPKTTMTTTTKKETLLSQVSVMNKKMRGFHNFKKDRNEDKVTTVSVSEIVAGGAQSPAVGADADADADAVVVGHGVVEKLHSPPMYASAAAQECVA